MKILREAFVVFVSVLVLSATAELHGQMNRRAIKKNNKQIGRYRGNQDIFKRYSGVGVSVNALNYFGDLSPLHRKISTDISFTKPAIGVSFFRCFGPQFQVNWLFMYGSLRAADAHTSEFGNQKFRYQRNLSFRNRIEEFSAVAIYDLIHNPGSNYVTRRIWAPYVYLGVAAFAHNPQGKAPATYLDGNPNPNAGQWVDLRPLGTEGQYSALKPDDVNYGVKPYRRIQVAVPFGLGVRFKLNEVLDLSTDIGFRWTFTDYLDDVSMNYVDLGVLTSPLAKAMSYRSNELRRDSDFSYTTYLGRDGISYTTISGYGSEYKTNNRGHSNNNDIYMVTSIKIAYILGAKFHHAKFRR